MQPESRASAAAFYDYNPNLPDDIPFYLKSSQPGTRILELGCGTGRVTIPLARAGRQVYGVDHSAEMLAVCGRKITAANLADRVEVMRGDITRLDLGQTFDLIIAPFRVIQNLETDEQVARLLEGIRRHLAPDGLVIVNAFNPNRTPAQMIATWCTDHEQLAWEVDTPGGKIACFGRHVRMGADPLVLYPELVYRRYVGSELAEETVLPLVMRCYYPAEFEMLMTAAGFVIVGRSGGYAGQRYGRGPELILTCRRTIQQL